MALINCPECEKEISDTCSNCIHCGYSLKIPDITIEAPVKSESKAKFSKIIRRYRLPLVLFFAAVVLAIVLILVFSSRTVHHPFDKLYIGQTRESVQNALGKPDRIKNKEPGEKYSWNIDDYYNVRFLGNSGNLSIWYDDNNMISHAWFEYDYPINPDNPSASPSSKERDNARAYAMSIIDFYTQKYGSHKNGYYDYEWSLMDGSKIGLSFNLDNEKFESVITIYWS